MSEEFPLRNLPPDDLPCSNKRQNELLHEEFLKELKHLFSHFIDNITTRKASVYLEKNPLIQEAMLSKINMEIDALIHSNIPAKSRYNSLVSKIDLNTEQILDLLKLQGLTEETIGSLLSQIPVSQDSKLFERILDHESCTVNALNVFMEENYPSKLQIFLMIGHKKFVRTSGVFSTIAKCCRVDIKIYNALRNSGFFNTTLIRTIADNKDTAKTVLNEMLKESHISPEQKNYIQQKLEEKQWKNKKDSV